MMKPSTATHASQKYLLNYGKELQQIHDAMISDEKIGKMLSDFMQTVQACELTIPVIGAFSAGKSTMLNTFLGRHILPTGITPETALATELRYAKEPYIEAFSEDDGSVSQFKGEDLSTIINTKGKYSFIRLYLNNDGLKSLEPLVLVDMPGFDSPNEQHNKSLFCYLNRGCHYFVLISVEEGTISQTLLRYLHTLHDCNKNFSIFLSKIDLKPKSEIDEIVNHIKHLAEDEFCTPVKVSTIDHLSIESLHEMIKSIDTNQIFAQIFVPSFLQVCDNCIEILNIRISTARKSKEQINSVIEEMDKSVKNLQIKAEKDAENIRTTYSISLIDDTIQEVGNALQSSLGELVNVAVTGNQPATEHRLNDIVNLALFNAMRNKLGNVNLQICRDFSHSIASLDRTMKDLKLDDNFADKMTFKIQTVFNSLGDVLDRGNGVSGLAGRIAGSNPLNVGYKAVTGGMLAAGITMPVIGALLVFLPEILNFLFKGPNEEKMRSAIRQKLETEVFPAIKRQIRVEITPMLQKELDVMINQVQLQYNEMISEKRNTLEHEAANLQTDAQAREEELQNLEQARDRIISMMNNVNQITQ